MDMGEGFESRENPKQEHWRKETQGRNSLMPPLLQNATVSELRMGWLVSSRGNELTFTDREVYSSNSVTDREVYASNTAEQCGRHICVDKGQLISQSERVNLSTGLQKMWAKHELRNLAALY